MSPDDLRKQFKAVYMAIGAQGSTALGVDSEEGKVLSGLAFLKAVREKNPTKIGKKVVVIGGGNTAIDAARTARRMGSEVTILYRRTAAEMPAYEEEVKAAKDEGVKIQFLCAPVKLGGSSKAVTVTCTKIELGSPDASGRPKPVPVKGSEFDVQCETLIAAIGQDINLTGLENIPRANNWIGADVLGQTTEKGIFAGGDAVTGPALVASAIGAGCKAALSIDAFIKGKKAELPEKMEVSYKDLPLRNASHFKHLQDIKRTEVEKLEASKRLANPDSEEALPFTQDQVMSESKRCLGCGSYKASFEGFPEYFGKICLACHDCESICPNDALIMPNFFRIDEGRFATDYDYPLDSRDGLPNPLRLEKPLPYAVGVTRPAVGAFGTGVARGAYEAALIACPAVDLKLAGVSGTLIGGEEEGAKCFDQASDRMHAAVAAIQCGIMKGSFPGCQTGTGISGYGADAKTRTDQCTG